ncbi:hypothetical protein MRX96_039968 [Rhipicephalus microplus]
MELINKAQGEANATLAKAEAKAKALSRIASSLGQPVGGNAASFMVAEQYVQAFKSLAKEGNTIILPANTGATSLRKDFTDAPQRQT